MILRRFILAFLSASMVLCPAFAQAQVSEESACFGTPVSLKGHFVYITKISRRLLRETVAEQQQSVRPRGLREQI